MRFIAFCLLVVFSLSAQADAYKCKDQSGKITISAKPCPDDTNQIKTVPDSSPSSGDYYRAQSDLNRQRAWLNNRRIDQANEFKNNPVIVPVDTYGNTEKIHACLMAVTATPRLQGSEAARRRVECYRGTTGRSAECESSVSATPMLSMSEESYLQSVCRTFQ